MPGGTGYIAIATNRRAGLALNAAGGIEGWGSDLSELSSGAPPGGGFVAIPIAAQRPTPGLDPAPPLGSTGVALYETSQIHGWGADDMNLVSNAPTPGATSSISRARRCTASPSMRMAA